MAIVPRSGETSPESLAKAEAAWTAALRLQQFVYANISFEVSTSLPHATHIVQGWLKAGKVRQIAPPAGRRASKLNFEVVPENEIRPAPVIGDAYEQMWTTIRKSRGFTPADLKATCALPITLEAAAAYCRFLLTAGYHPSLLPAFKGKGAIQATLDADQRFTGGTMYWLTDSVDGGPVVAAGGRRLQERVQVLPNETAAELWRRALGPLGLALTAAAVNALICT